MCIVKEAALGDSIALADLNDLRTFVPRPFSCQPCPCL